MYYISEFCRVCLQSEKPLIDIMKKEAEPETLVNKLKLCVSEVEWSTSPTILMCSSCIGKLNSAFEFKRQCLQSAQALESYFSQLSSSEDSQSSRVGGKVYVSLNRNDVKQELVDEYVKIQKEEEESQKPTAFIRVKSNQQLYPQLSNIILTTNNSQTTAFPNILLNLIPTTALKYPPPSLIVGKPSAKSAPSTPPIKDANQNMFVSINNTLHKILPVVTQAKENKSTLPFIKVPDDVNITRILTETKTEELSVEIDPMCFGPEDDHPTEENAEKDWEDLISTNKIGPEIKSEGKTLTLSDGLTITPSKPGLFKMPHMNPNPNSYVPIRPKKRDYPIELDEKVMEFLNIDHFMAPKESLDSFCDPITKSIMCEQCGQACDTLKSLRYHIKQFHMGKFPYKCHYCNSVYAIKGQYESHMQKHMLQANDAFTKDTITLEDLSIQNQAFLFPSPPPPASIPKPTVPTPETPESSDDANNIHLEHKCEMCPRSFNSAHGLSRHKVRKHNQAAKKKYFIKGMKNAKCEICNREFSTQSYLQLHIKLHYRKNDYRLKVFNKERYEQEQKAQENNDEDARANLLRQLELKENTPRSESKVIPKENDCVVEEKMECTEAEDIEEPKTDPLEITDNEKLDDSASEGITSKEEDVKELKPPEGIKIKINLKNIKQSNANKSPEKSLINGRVEKNESKRDCNKSVATLNADLSQSESPKNKVEVTNSK